MKYVQRFKYWLVTIAAYVILILIIDSLLHTWFELSDVMAAIIEIFGAIIIYNGAIRLFQYYKSKQK